MAFDIEAKVIKAAGEDRIIQWTNPGQEGGDEVGTDALDEAYLYARQTFRNWAGVVFDEDVVGTDDDYYSSIIVDLTIAYLKRRGGAPGEAEVIFAALREDIKQIRASDHNATLTPTFRRRNERGRENRPIYEAGTFTHNLGHPNKTTRNRPGALP